MKIISVIRAVFVVRADIKFFNIISVMVFIMEVDLKPLNIIIITVTIRAMRKKETANEKN